MPRRRVGMILPPAARSVRCSQSSNRAVSNSVPRISRSISVTDELSLKKMGVAAEVTTDSSHRPQSPLRLNSNPE
ncbi:cytoplasmic phosphatidylinositol transfer protein 1-like [Arapaima gigas]